MVPIIVRQVSEWSIQGQICTVCATVRQEPNAQQDACVCKPSNYLPIDQWSGRGIPHQSQTPVC